jgi:hypothetical protein
MLKRNLGSALRARTHWGRYRDLFLRALTHNIALALLWVFYRAEVSKLIADPAKFSGTVYFKIAADGGVKVVPLTQAEMERLAFAQKKYP